MMELTANLALGFAQALSLTNIFYCFVGVFVGTLVGVLPGIGSLAAISMLLPVTFYLNPGTALVMLAGVYYGAEYGGSIASILLNLPGTTSSAVVCLDGHPMAKRGKAGVALFITAIGSFVGAMLGIVVLLILTPRLVDVALSFGPADYFAIMLLGLVAAATISSGSPMKGIAMVLFGLVIGCVGTDIDTGQPRFTFGLPGLVDGISIVVLAMGMFGVSEIIASILRPKEQELQSRITVREMIPTYGEMRQALLPILRGTAVGSFFGALPGTGHTIASFMSYALEKKVARDSSRFGHGAIEGIAAPESANNAACQTAFIPTLALGIPGSATMALMLGALMIHGITPGPRLVTDHPEVFWGLIASFFVGNILLLLLNIPLIGIWVRVLRIPYNLLYPAVIALVCIGVYSINNNPFDIGLLAFFGLLGYVLRLGGFSPAPALVGFVLGPMVEEYLRRALLLAQGDATVFLTRPISATVLFMAVALIVWASWSHSKQRRRSAEATA